ncbi:hypothetical protein PHMEG_00040221 [Phytophthora megakarya]|uniref:Uncharacterized protein n=1 Tax=Phytophthora megakarya TaxID=4795 RepID=A0A225UEC7_9STRA|nr:hypothetical protein PHMEG_00040221 [Phytophthora megakarya]
MRSILAANPASVGLGRLDEIANALIDEDEDGASDFFDSLVVLVPDPSRQRSGGMPPDHDIFTDSLKHSRPQSPAKALDPVLVPKAGSHAIKKLKVDFDNPPSAEAKEQTASPTTAEKLPSGKKKKAPAAAKQSRITTSAKKKERAAPAKKKATRSATAEAMDTNDEVEEDAELVAQFAALKTELAEFIDFPIAEVADMAITEAVLKLFKEAKGNGLVLARKAYPWQGQFLWHNPRRVLSALALVDE